MCVCVHSGNPPMAVSVSHTCKIVIQLTSVFFTPVCKGYFKQNVKESLFYTVYVVYKEIHYEAYSFFFLSRFAINAHIVHAILFLSGAHD